MSNVSVVVGHISLTITYPKKSLHEHINFSDPSKVMAARGGFIPIPYDKNYLYNIRVNSYWSDMKIN